MKKKNLVIVALASVAFAIAGGAVLAQSLNKATSVEATPIVDGTKLNYVQVMFQLSDTNNTDCSDDWDGAYYYLELTGGAKNTTAPGIELFHQPGSSKISEIIDASEYAGWTSVKVHRGTSTGTIYQSTEAKTVSANTKNFFKVTYGRGTNWESIWWRNEGSEEKFARVDEYAVLDGVAESDPFSYGDCWNSDSFNPETPARAGYDFGGWFTNQECTIPFSASTIAHDSKLFAKFTSKPWSVRGKGVAFPDKDGDGNTNFDADDALTMVVNNTSEVMIQNITLTAGDVFEFTDGTKWLGWSDVKPGTPDANPINACFKAGANDNNIEVVNSGTYTFYVDVTKESGTANSIWITQQAYVDIDGWSDGFNKVADFCDIGDTDWATYAASFAELDPDAQDIFNKATANADEHASNIERAAARYDYAVGTKGKTAFAGGSRAKNALFISPMSKGTDNGGVAAVAVTAAIGVGAAVGLIFLRRRRVL